MMRGACYRLQVLLSLHLILILTIVKLLTHVGVSTVQAQRSLSINIVHKAADSHHHHHDHHHHHHDNDDHHHDSDDHQHGHRTGPQDAAVNEVGTVSAGPRPPSRSRTTNGYFGPRNPIRYDFSAPTLPRPPRRPPTIGPAPRPRFPPSRFPSSQISLVIDQAKAHLERRLSEERQLFLNLRRISDPYVHNQASKSGGSNNDNDDVVNANNINAGLNVEWALTQAAQDEVAVAKVRNSTTTALLAEEATRLLSGTHGLNAQAVAHELPTVDIRETDLDRLCPQRFEHPCPPRKYRSFSGHCNNVQNPYWGSSGTRYGRFLAPDYSDGIAEPRMHSSLGSTLPSARNVSLRFHSDADMPHPHVNVMFVALAEFVTLDLANTAVYTGPNRESLRCCGVPLEFFHPECYPVRVPAGDPVYKRSSCLNYARSAPGLRTGCTLGPREQINQATSFIDASPLYGNDENESTLLRLFRGGELRTDTSTGREMPPMMPAGAPRLCRGQVCSLAGDLRINENGPLASMHALWLREHNRIARALSKLNPHWGDHTLFEEARRIVIAELQHIVYAEMLPAMIGSDLMDRYRLRPQSSGYFEDYNINMDPSTANEAATAVLHFAVSMMPGYVELLDISRRDFQKTQMDISKTFYAPNEVRSHMDEFLLGMLGQHAQTGDEHITRWMTNSQLVNASRTSPVLDTVSTLIQRGRDHGIPGYTAFRKFCGLSSDIGQFEDLVTVTTPETAKKLAYIYQSVDDVDLFVGGLAETPLEGSVVGPTFACLLALQFQRSKHGDRFYYENDLPPSRFSKEQLSEIRHTSLARVLCDNTDVDDHLELQPSSLVMSDHFLNAEERCSSPGLQRVDLSPWKSQHSTDLTDQLNNEQLQRQLRQARRQLVELRGKEIHLQKMQGDPDRASSQAVLSALLRPNEDALRLSNESLLLELASKGIILSSLRKVMVDRDSEHPRSNVNDLLTMLADVELPEEFRPTRIPGHCDEAALPCDHTAKYRTMTGWCNNLRRPSLGKSLTPFARISPARYADGLSELVSTGVSGQPLPNPRVVSTSLHYDVAEAHRRYTLMVMQWGQFLDHDITLTPMVEYPDKSNINCKRCDSQVTVHPECRPIPVPPGDIYFPTQLADGSNNCISFVRSLPGQQSLGARQQLNQVTAFIDASSVYGSNRCEMRRLRSYRGGRLNFTDIGSTLKPLLPQTATHKECRAPSRLCFMAGDMRASEQPGLAAMHTLFLREHNRVVNELSQINPHWDDERLFQEGRRIVSAELQQITFGEFLPRVLGRVAMDHYHLNLQLDGYSHEYDPQVDPSVWNEFSSAAFRFGHTLIAPFFKLLGAEYSDQRQEAVQLRNGFFNSDILHRPGAMDALLRGLVSASMQQFDSAVTEEVTNHLFEERRKPFSGMDLIALNIQRARDHGIDGYNVYREKCNLTRAASFEELTEIPEALRRRLAKVYAHVDDIDLFTGGLAERSVYGAVVGPTFACLIGKQFSKLKRGDRFFFENGDPVVRFSESQLASLRSATLARLVCDNGDRIERIQRNAFDQIDDFLNPRVSCNSLRSVNLNLWLDRSSCSLHGKDIPLGQSLAMSPCKSCTCTTEGLHCVTVRVADCFALLRGQDQSASEILKDGACRVQCAFAMAISAGTVDVQTQHRATITPASRKRSA